MESVPVAFRSNFDHGLPPFVQLVGEFEILQLNLTTDKLFVKLGKRAVKALEKFESG